MFTEKGKLSVPKKMYIEIIPQNLYTTSDSNYYPLKIYLKCIQGTVGVDGWGKGSGGVLIR